MTNPFSHESRQLAKELALVGLHYGIMLTEGALTILRSLHDSLRSIEPLTPEVEEAAADVTASAAAPAVPVEDSVTADHVLCLEEGKSFKTLKRHLRTAHGLTPAQYRAKWGLSADHPLVAPSYAAVRSSVAKKIGLGGKHMRRSARRSKQPVRPAA